MTYKFPDAVLAQHQAVLGKTGSGKTSTEKLIVEQVVAAGFRVCILDPIKSDWWGITSSADGKKPGLPFKILGGPHGHVPLHDSAGKAIGQLVGSGKLPLSIIDMADFGAGGLQKFFVDFAPALMKSAKGVLYLVIEEAHEFAPKERAGFGQENLSIHWAKKLATAGRSKGIRLIVATQRTQSLHNAVLGSCETIITHRLTTPADQKPVLEWLKANTDKAQMETVAAAISSLPTGTGIIVSGEAKIFQLKAFPKFKTYDNAATPESDADHIEVKTAAVDQDELRSIIGDAVQEAEANDPKLLKAKIAKLEATIAASAQKVAPKPGLDAKDLEQAEKVGFAKGYRKSHDSITADLDKINKHWKALHIPMTALIEVVESVMTDHASRWEVPVFIQTERHSGIIPVEMTKRIAQNELSRPSLTDRRKSEAAIFNGEKLPPGEQAILVAAAQFNSLDRDSLTVLTGYKRSSRDAYIARLLAKGFIEVQGRSILPTREGLTALPPGYEPLPSGRDLQRYWLDKLPVGEAKILQALLDVYPNQINKADLDDITGFKRSSRDAYIARMKHKRLVDIMGSQISASQVLF